MFKFRPYDLLEATWMLEVAQKEAYEKRETSAEQVPNKIAESDRLFYQKAVDVMRVQSEKFEFQSVLDQLDRINTTLKIGSLYGAYSTYATQAQQVWECLKTDLAKRAFMFMPSAEANYYQRDDLFGSEVRVAFPESNDDIIQAGNCYATGNYTAAVFHLTRVLEAGLKALALDVGAVFADLDAENWETIINKVESTIDGIRAQPRSSAKAANLEFYSGAAKQFRHFKDHWRNPVNHFRSRYDGPQALSAITHVRDFMQHIATKLTQEA